LDAIVTFSFSILSLMANEPHLRTELIEQGGTLLAEFSGVGNVAGSAICSIPARVPRRYITKAILTSTSQKAALLCM
jgi:hypothetical protein